MNHWKERNVLVTGATGLVGSWLLPKLVERGANVTILMRDETILYIFVSDRLN